MLMLSLLGSAAAAVILALVLQMFIGGYPRGNSPASIIVGQPYQQNGVDSFPAIVPAWFAVLIHAGPHETAEQDARQALATCCRGAATPTRVTRGPDGSRR